MNLIRYIPFFVFFFFLSCQKEAIPEGQISDSLWLEHKGAQMPILVEGNISSGTLILLLHGGPGGSAKGFNETAKSFSKPLEERYAVAYYDQRLAGNTRGNYDPSTVTVAQVVEDLDVVIDLLKDQYGEELKIFLYGVSWGGYLGNAYLSTGNNQQKIQGWIDVAGAHNLEKVTYDGVALMEEIAIQQMAANSQQNEDWQLILDYVEEFDTKTDGRTITIDKPIHNEANAQGNVAMTLAARDSLIAGPNSGGDGGLGAFLFQDNNVLTSLGNKLQNDRRTNLIDEILTKPLTDKLKNITIPSLLLWGQYDFVVPPSLGEEMLEKLGTPMEDKYLIILEQSGHNLSGVDTDKLVEEVISFVERYK